MNETVTVEIPSEELVGVYENLDKAASQLRDMITPYSRGIELSIHNVPLNKLDQTWEFELVSSGDNPFMVARKSWGVIRLTAYLAR